MIPSVLAGALGWSLTEYLLHRFDGHAMRGRTRFSRDHLAHHADSAHFAPTSYKIGVAAAVIAVLAAVAMLAAGPARGLAFTVGFAVAYGAYEVVHRRIHTHAPRGPYGRWVRRHHLHHHHRSPRANHGVTSPLWDWVFRTWEPAGRVRIAASRADPWMLDDRGDLRDAWSADYEIVRRRRS